MTLTLPIFDDADHTDTDAWLHEYRNPLRREMEKALLGMTADATRQLVAMGMPAAELMAAHLIGRCHAETDRYDFWQPADDGPIMLVTPAIERGQVIDLVAFNPAEPDAWFLRTGAAWTLGREAIDDAIGAWSGHDDGVDLHATPLDWLRYGGDGACIVDWCDEARTTLRNVAKVRVTAPAMAHMLRLELTRPPKIPEITVTRLRRHAA